MSATRGRMSRGRGSGVDKLRHNSAIRSGILSIMVIRVLVTGFASISCLCGLITVQAAWAELRRVQTLRGRMMTKAHPVMEALARRPYRTISDLQVERT